MAQLKPAHSLNVYGSFGYRLDREAVEYRRRLTKKIVPPPLQWDCIKEGLDIFAVKTERKCVQLQAEQERMKQDVKGQKKLNESRLQQVEELLQGSLHQQFIDINSFVRDCHDKEQKAKQKCDEELQKQNRLTGDIQRLEKDLQKLLNFKSRMEECVDDLKCYEETIAQLVADSEHLSTPKDFMDKCDALMLAQLEISEMEVQKLRAIEDCQRGLIRVEQESATDLLGMTNSLVTLDQEYERAHRQGIAWEQVLVKSRDVIVHEEVQYTRIVDATRQLYLLLCKRNGRDPRLQHTRLEDQLDYIKEEAAILAEVLHRATEFMHAEEKSVAGERGTGQ